MLNPHLSTAVEKTAKRTTANTRRVSIEGKFLFDGSEKFYIKVVTYGTFASSHLSSRTKRISKSFYLSSEVGENTKLDINTRFKYSSFTIPAGSKNISNNTFCTSSLNEEDPYIKLGNYTFIPNASIACYYNIKIGTYVFIDGGVTIVNSDLHSIAPSARFADTIAILNVGTKSARPRFTSYRVIAKIKPGICLDKNSGIGCKSIVQNNVPPLSGRSRQSGSITKYQLQDGSECQQHEAMQMMKNKSQLLYKNT